MFRNKGMLVSAVSIVVFLAVLAMPAFAAFPTDAQWIPYVSNDWEYIYEYITDNSDYRDLIPDLTHPTESSAYWYFDMATNNVYFRMMLNGNPIRSTVTELRSSWFWHVMIESTGNSYPDYMITVSGVSSPDSIYTQYNTNNDIVMDGNTGWSVSQSASPWTETHEGTTYTYLINGYVRVGPIIGSELEGSQDYYIDLYVPLSALARSGGATPPSAMTTITPMRFTIGTSEDGDTNASRAITVDVLSQPSGYDIVEILGEMEQTPLDAVYYGTYGVLRDTRHAPTIPDQGTWYSGETVTLSGYGWPVSGSTMYRTSLPVEIRDSGGTVVWSGTVPCSTAGVVSSTATWAIGGSAASGVYSVYVSDPRSPSGWLLRDKFTAICDNGSVDVTKTVTDVDGGGALAPADEAGDVITYRVDVYNDGSINNGGSLTDNLPGISAISGPVEIGGSIPGTLEPGETWRYTYTYTVQQADIDNDGKNPANGFINNTATFDPTNGDNDSGSASVEVDQNPSVSVTKSVTDVGGDGPTGYADLASEVISYQVEVYNDGNVTNGGSLADSLPGISAISGPVESLSSNGILNVGETWTYTYTYTVLQSDIDNNGDGSGYINNTATFDPTYGDNDSDSEAVMVDQIPSVSVNKSVTDVDGEGAAAHVNEAGDVISYQVQVLNDGNVSNGGSLTDNLPGISLISGPVESLSSNGVLNVGETWTYTYTYTATQADIDNDGGGDGDIDNTATFDPTYGSNDSDDEAVPVDYILSMTTTKAVTDVDGGGPTGVVNEAGDVISYQVDVYNDGNVSNAGVLVDNLSGISAISGPQEIGGSIPGVLEPGETWRFTYTYTAQQEDLDNDGKNPANGFINNGAAFFAELYDPAQMEDYSDSCSVPVVRLPSVAVTKTVTDVDGGGGGAHADSAGDVISYQVEVFNDGNVSNGGSLSDSLLGISAISGPVESGLSDGILSVGETWTYTYTYSVTQSDLDNNGGGDGDIDNTATFEPTFGADDSDSAAVALTRNPHVSIEKTFVADPPPAGNGVIDLAGEMIYYTVVVTNDGNVTLTGSLSDSLPGISGISGPLPSTPVGPGGTWTYTYYYTVSQADLDNNGGGDGDIDNTATFDPSEGGNVSDSCEVPFLRRPAWNIVKSVIDVDGAGPSGSVDEAGDEIDYRVVLTNTGNISLTGIVLHDPLVSDNVGSPMESVSPNGQLNVGETWTYDYSYDALQADLDNNGGGDGDIDNTAWATSSQLPSEIFDSCSVPIVRRPSVSIDKTYAADPPPAGNGAIDHAGELIYYQVVVTNTGNVTLTGSLSESLPGISAISGPSSSTPVAPGGTWTFTYTYTVSQADIDDDGGGDGDIDNEATFSPSEGSRMSDRCETPISRTPGWTVVKSVVDVDGAGPSGSVDEAGDEIDYRVVLTNTGNVRLDSIDIHDPLVSDNVGSPVESISANGVLNIGETWTYNYSYIALQSDIDGNGGGDGDIDNEVTAYCLQIQGAFTSSCHVPINRNRVYSIAKYVDAVDGAGNDVLDNAGELIEYRVVVTNLGNVTVIGAVTDSLVSPVGAPVESISSNGQLNVGETWTYTYTYTVPQAAFDNNGGGDGDIDNTATFTPDAGPPVTASRAVTIALNPHVKIQKTVTAIDATGNLVIDNAGEVIGYQVAVVNDGNVTLTGSLADTLVAAVGAPIESISANGQLNVGETWIYNYLYIVTQSDIDHNGGGDGDIDNTATFTPSAGSPASDSRAVGITRVPHVKIQKAVSSIDAAGNLVIDHAGELIGYQVVVVNDGNVTLTGSLVDTLVAAVGAPIESISANGLLNVGEAWTYDYIYTVTQADIDTNGGGDGDIDNTATFDPSEGANASDSKAVPLAQGPHVSVAKTVTAIDAAGNHIIDHAGEVISYQVVVTNDGNLSLTGTLAESLAGISAISGPVESVSSNGILNVGETWTYTYTYTVPQAVLDNNGGGDGDIDNAATFTPSAGSPATDSESVAIVRNPHLQVAKRISAIDIAGNNIIDHAGEVISYLVIVINDGNVTLTGTLADTLVAPVGSPVESHSTNGQLNVGETWSYGYNYVVTQADLDNNGGGDGDIDNTATFDPNEGPNVSSSAAVPLARNPHVSIEKLVTAIDAAGDDTIDHAGEIISYRVVVTNDGNVTLSGTLSDSLVAPVGSPVESISANGQLNVGETWTYSYNYAVTQADLDHNGGGDGDIDNTATFDPSEGPNVTDSETVPILRSPHLSIAKSVIAVDASGNHILDHADELIDYRVVVTNDGNVTMTGVLSESLTVALPVPIESISSNGLLNVGETWTYNYSYAVPQVAFDNNGGGDGDIDNTATFDPSEGINIYDSEAVPLRRGPHVSVLKTATGKDTAGNGVIDHAGELIAYQVVVTNDGNVTVTGSLAESLSGISAVTGPVESVSSNGSLNVGETWTYTYSYAVPQAAFDNNGGGDGDIDNTATFTPSIGSPASDSEAVPLRLGPHVSVLKTATGKDTAGNGVIDHAGELIAYQVVVTNDGNQTLTGTLADSLPGISPISGPVESVSSNGQLNVGETWTYTYTYAVTQADFNNNAGGDGEIDNVATFTPSLGAPAQSSEAVDIQVVFQWGINKTATETSVSAPGLLHYTVVLSNSGNVDLTGILLTDTLVANPGTPVESVSANGVLNVGETWTWTYTFNVTQGMINDGGDIVNTASATCAELPGRPLEGHATVPVDQSPAWSIDKTVLEASVSAPGLLHYTVVLTNGGNVDLTGISMVDSLVTNPGAPVESISTNAVLNVGESWTWTYTYSVTQEMINSGGSIMNSATAICDELPEDPAYDDTWVEVVQQPAWSIDKSVLETSVSAPGLLHYTVVLSNDGNIDLTGISLVDSLVTSPGTPVESLLTDGILGVGEDWTWTYTFAVTQEMINAGGIVENTASATSDQLYMPVSEGAEVPIIQNPAWSILKTSDKDTISEPGDIHYTVVLSNTGNVDLTSIELHDSLAANPGEPVESISDNDVLNVGETWTWEYTIAVTEEMLEEYDVIINTAVATSEELPEAPASTISEVPVDDEPSWTLTKTADKSEIGGPGTITYTIVLTNTGNVVLTGVEILDSLIGDLGMPTETLIPNGILDVGESWAWGCCYTVTQEMINAGADIVNTATAMCNQLPEDPATDSWTVHILQHPAWSITKIADVETIGAPGTLHYTVTLVNEGNVDLTGVELEDTLVDEPGEPAESLDDDGVLKVGETWTWHYTVEVGWDALFLGDDIVNTASASCDQEASGPSTSTFVVTVIQDPNWQPGLEITKEAEPESVSVGDIVTYRVTVVNRSDSYSPMPAYDVVLVDDLPAGFSYIPGTSYLDGSPISDPTPVGADLVWWIGDMDLEDVHVLTYKVGVGAGALKGDGINYVLAEGENVISNPFETEPVSKKVYVIDSAFSSLGAIMGKVFDDKDGDGFQDEGEEGIAGAEVIMDDGMTAMTDENGMYHIGQVKPGVRSIKVNKWSLPEGSELTNSFKDFTGISASFFVDVLPSGVARADFAVGVPDDAPEADPDKIEPAFISGTIELTHNFNSFANSYIKGRAFFRKEFEGGSLVLRYDSEQGIADGLYSDAAKDPMYDLYGDQSSASNQSSSSNGFYVKLDTRYFDIMWGDFNAGYDSVELASFKSNVTGAEASLDINGFTVTGFVAPTRDGMETDRIAGNGTSGYFFLEEFPLVVGSESVYVIRTRFYDESVILDRKQLVHGLDYEIDYSTGSILLADAMPSFDDEGNKYFLEITYTAAGGDYDGLAAGVRLHADFGAFDIGATTAIEHSGAETDAVFGADMGLDFGEAFRLDAEAAVSMYSGTYGGYAIKAGAASKIGILELRVETSATDGGFVKPGEATPMPEGVTLYGYAGLDDTYPLILSLTTYHAWKGIDYDYSTENKLVAGYRLPLSFGLDLGIAGTFTYAEDPESMGGIIDAFVEVTPVPQLVIKAFAQIVKFGNPIDNDGDYSLSLSYKPISSLAVTLAYVTGLELDERYHKLNLDARLMVTEEGLIFGRLSLPFGSRATSVFSFGYKDAYKLAEGLRFSFSAEATVGFGGPEIIVPGSARVAASAMLEYAAKNNFKAYLKQEVTYGGEGLTSLTKLDVRGDVTDWLSLEGNAAVYYGNSPTRDGLPLSAEAGLGMAIRPENTIVTGLLKANTKYFAGERFESDEIASITTATTDWTVEAGRFLSLTAKAGYKLAAEGLIGGELALNHTLLLQSGVSLHITRTTDVEAFIRAIGWTGNWKLGYSVQLVQKIFNLFSVAVGYNSTDLADTDIPDQKPWEDGFYLKAMIKF